MPAPDLEAFKVAAGELSSATKFNNLVQAIEDEFSDIDPDQITGYPADSQKLLRGDGSWDLVVAPAARVYHDANQSINSGAPTVLAFNQERFDVGGFHDTVTNNSRLTVPTGKGGTYLITSVVQWGATTTGFRSVSLRLNGTTTIAQQQVEVGAGGSEVTILSITTIYSLVAGDYVEVVAYQSSAGALNAMVSGDISPTFAIARVA